VRRDADAPVAPAVAVAELRLRNLRCLADAHLPLHPRFNLITGDNGAGKTSLLEAVYLLGRGRSFRTRRVEQLIRSGATAMGVSGAVHPGGSGPTDAQPLEAREQRVALQCDRDRGVAAELDGRPIESLAELAALLPIQVIDPGIHRLIEEGPTVRRSWLDWAMFHVEPQFLMQWRGYRRALRQRNAALRSGADASLWDTELQRFGEPLTQARARLVEALQPAWRETLETLDAAPATMRFRKGWAGNVTVAECLSEHAPRDRERGLTTQGPHHFDVDLRIEGRAVRDTVSRGQQKLLGAAMALSMARLLSSRATGAPVLLLDDPAAELDGAHTQALLVAAEALDGQRIVTALRSEGSLTGPPDALFHVERGEVKQL
jgi:DNA replication and repair protein RecF